MSAEPERLLDASRPPTVGQSVDYAMARVERDNSVIIDMRAVRGLVALLLRRSGYGFRGRGL